MGLVTDSIRDTFDFAVKFPKSFVLAFVLALITSLANLVTKKISASMLIGISWEDAALIIIVSVVSSLLSVLISVSYPILVYQAAREGKISIKRAVLISLRKFGKILLTLIIFVVIFSAILSPIILLAIFDLIFDLSASNLFLFLIPFIIFLPVCTILALYILFKLTFVIPIIMIENKGVVESFKASWRKTKNYLLSIFAAIFLLSLIIFAISIPFTLAAVGLDFFNLIYMALIPTIIGETITYNLSLPFITILYLKIIKRVK